MTGGLTARQWSRVIGTPMILWRRPGTTLFQPACPPRGEAFFIETLRDFCEDLPPKLAREIKAFTTQEINHTREHVAFNRLVSDHGYDAESIDQGIRAMLELTEGRPKEFNLAITIALEHFASLVAIANRPRGRFQSN